VFCNFRTRLSFVILGLCGVLQFVDPVGFCNLRSCVVLYVGDCWVPMLGLYADM
jgi:hypothetical protein